MVFGDNLTAIHAYFAREEPTILCCGGKDIHEMLWVNFLQVKATPTIPVLLMLSNHFRLGYRESALIGLPVRKPCMSTNPMSMQTCASSSISTPSARGTEPVARTILTKSRTSWRLR